MKNLKKITALLLAVILLTLSLASCSAPEYSEIEERLKFLIDESAEVNKLIFGEGLPTYERVYEPEIEAYRGEKNYYYYVINDKELGKIIAYRGMLDFKEDYKYLLESKTEQSGKTALYVNEAVGKYYYPIDYTEKKYDFYYDEDSPENYDYVKADSEITSIDQIKEIAQKVYSAEYLNAVYETLFSSGVSLEDSDVSGLVARYIEYEDSDLGTVLMESNTYEPYITEKRIFNYDTAKIVRPSNKQTVNVEMESYLESNPEKLTSVRITLVMQDGEWYLDSPTY